MNCMRPKFFFILSVLISLVFHAGVFLMVKPLITARPTPVLTSWLDLLSLQDLKIVERPAQPLDSELFIPAKDKGYFLSPLDKEQIIFATGERELYSPSPLRIPLRKDAVQSVVFQKQVIPLLQLFESQNDQLQYNACVTPRGRVLLTSPLTLPFDTFTPMYIEEQLKESTVFLGRDKFYWTRVEVVIE